jgi:hypothetical protein
VALPYEGDWDFASGWFQFRTEIIDSSVLVFNWFRIQLAEFSFACLILVVACEL